ncbi:hypothetical protein HBB16_09490 [Pseudonocardia sp. MCCB 268]|nr:hypothetical protein [Pseudonocardia cytotoxica]
MEPGRPRDRVQRDGVLLAGGHRRRGTGFPAPAVPAAPTLKAMVSARPFRQPGPADGAAAPASRSGAVLSPWWSFHCWASSRPPRSGASPVVRPGGERLGDGRRRDTGHAWPRGMSALLQHAPPERTGSTTGTWGCVWASPRQGR